MRPSLRTAAACLSLALGACAVPSRQPQGQTLDEIIAENGIVCSGAQQCSELWRRTQYWISTNSGFKIQTATDVVIETYNPPAYSSRWGFAARKEPLSAGQERITILPSCGQAPICRETKGEMLNRARSYVLSQ
jgi:hypothetical protein